MINRHFLKTLVVFVAILALGMITVFTIGYLEQNKTKAGDTTINKNKLAE